MNEKKTIIITGCNGLIGTILCNALIKEYFIIGIDIVAKENPQVDIFVLGDLTTSSRVEKVLTLHQKIYGLIHLALGMPNELDGEGMENDVEMSRVVAEMCDLCGIENVVYASSNHVTGGYEKDETFKPILRGEKESTLSEWNRISHRWQFWPDGPYGCAKMCGEQIFGKLLFHSSSCNVSCLRIGTVLKDDRPITPRHQCTWLSHTDLIQLVSKCLALRGGGFNIFYGVSDNKGRIWQIENAVDLLQYQPISDAQKINK